MRKKPTYLVIVALTATAVALPLSALAQQPGTMPHPTVTPRQRVQTLKPLPRHVRPSPRGARLPHGPLPSHKFGGHVYRGHLAWKKGRWHHEMRNGRYGWWWDVGGVWYFYPQQIEGPPAYISDIDAVEEPTAEPEPVPPPRGPHHTFYYRPGDIKGVPYDTFDECWQARQREADVGICVIK